MTVLIKALSRLNRWQLEIFRYSTMFMVVVIACVIAAGVFFRYVLNDSLSWSEELAKYAMLWMVFLGAPIALRTGGHPNIEILLNLVPRRFSILVAAKRPITNPHTSSNNAPSLRCSKA